MEKWITLSPWFLAPLRLSLNSAKRDFFRRVGSRSLSLNVTWRGTFKDTFGRFIWFTCRERFFLPDPGRLPPQPFTPANSNCLRVFRFIAHGNYLQRSADVNLIRHTNACFCSKYNKRSRSLLRRTPPYPVVLRSTPPYSALLRLTPPYSAVRRTPPCAVLRRTPPYSVVLRRTPPYSAVPRRTP